MIKKTIKNSQFLLQILQENRTHPRGYRVLGGTFAFVLFLGGCTTPQEPRGSRLGVERTSSVQDQKIPIASGDTIILSDSIRLSLSGIDRGPHAPQDSQSIEEQTQALKTAKKIIAYSKAPSSPASKKDFHRCQNEEPEWVWDATFCRAVTGLSGGKRRMSPAQQLKKQLNARRVSQLVNSLKKKKWDEIKGVQESQLIQALKRSGDAERVKPFSERLLSESSCQESSVLTAMGTKMEERFPDPTYKTLAMGLYEKSGKCGKDPSAIKALYRLGLLKIWDQNWEEAEQALVKVFEWEQGLDFKSRVLYWRHFVAQQLKDRKKADSLKAQLIQDHPLSLHALVLSEEQEMVERSPWVKFRSAAQKSLNPVIAVAEALQKEGASRWSILTLESITELVLDAEPEVQLYVGLLFMRAGDTLNKFKILSSLFKNYPGIVTRESMEMMFPLSRFELVRNHENLADPYLMISLIRQESAFNERARSRVGAMGLMQLMPQTARRMERVSKKALFDPQTNVRLGVRFFSHLHDRYSGETELALAAYNAGPGAVDIWKNRYPIENRLLFVDLIPYRETREYVASIARNYYFYRKLYSADAREDRTPAAPKAPVFRLFET